MKMLCVGEILIDMIGKDRSLKKTEKFHARPGGAPANVAVAASKMGADVHMAATVGKDGLGDKLVEKLEREGVGVQNIDVSEKKTSLAFVALNEAAEPEFSFYRGADTEISEKQLEGEYDIIHFGSLPFTEPQLSERFLEFAKSSEAIISFDPNLRSELADGNYEERLKEFMQVSDLVFLSYEEDKQLSIDIPQKIVTKGADGAEIMTPDENISISPPEVEPVDTTGAGDALTGAYLAFKGEVSRKTALQNAVNASALSTLEKGAMSAIPDRNQLEQKFQ